ncbi:MAG TPA: hypothetical protein VFZ59_06505 [Verrucomicrobiae bacterium]|nr:hypothetical protein [Verrucomicrobiae bacterium]
MIRTSATPGDSHWDRQFGAPGTASVNLALRFIGNKLYAGGYSLANGQVSSNTVINVYDGTNWSTLGGISGGLSTTILYDFAVLGNDLYVAGIFNHAGGVPAAGLAKWDGTTWSDVGGFEGVVLNLATDGTNLYAGGSFTNCGGVFATNIAKWNGTNWSPLGAGIGYFNNNLSQVVAVLLWHDGQLYAGGSFTNVGAAAVTNLARWDGSNWSAVGGGVAGTGGIFGSPVSALQFIGDDLYVGGRFTAVGGGVAATNVARWNGSAWSPLGTGLRGPPNSAPVTALAALGSELYAFGGFTNAGGVTASGLARWNGASWSAFGALNGSRSRAISHNGSIYISGDFNVANYDTPTSTMANHIVRWDGSTWHAIPGVGWHGTHFFVYTIEVGNDGLYAGGLFAAIGGTAARRVARWDGNDWHPLGSGVDTEYNGVTLSVRFIRAQNSDVFVGGSFVNAGGMTANNIAKWDGFNWSPLGYGVDSTVLSVETVGTAVYAGGGFTNAYNAPGFGFVVNRIARWEPGTGWSPLGSGMNGNVNVIRQQNGLIYAGGSFTTAGGNTANRIAVWDGNAWSSLGAGAANGLGGTVNTILVDGSDVYVGGSFSTAGGATARGIAHWNGSTWSTLGQGFFHSSAVNVYGLAKMGNNLYACGGFTNAGGVVTRNIARWDGSKWEALGSGIGNEASAGISRGFALASSGNDLYVSGVFETAGLSDAGYIARWNDQIDFAPAATLRLAKPQMLPGNTFKFQATSSDRVTYVVEHSADLANWEPLTTNDVYYLNVTNAAPGVNFRTYRMRQLP